MILKRKDDVVLRKVHDIYYLIDIRSNYYGDKCYLYELNDIGAYIWENINGNDVESLSKMIYEIINDEIEYDVIYNDVENYITLLCSEGFIVK